MTISLTQFEKNTVGKTLCNPHTGDFCGECVSGVRQYIEQVCGLTTVSQGNAVDYWTSKWILQHFDRVPAGQEQNGDILVWGDDPGNWTGPYGHIAIRWSPGKMYGQNFAGKRYMAIDNFFPQGYLGALRLKPTTPKGGDMDANLTDAQWQDFIKKVYKGFSARTPTATEVSFHLKNSNPLSFVNGFATFKWEDDEKSLKDVNSQLSTANSKVKTLTSQVADLKKQLATAPVESDSDDSRPTGNATEVEQDTNSKVSWLVDAIKKIFNMK